MCTAIQAIHKEVLRQKKGFVLEISEHTCEFLLPSQHIWEYKLGCALKREESAFVIALGFESLPIKKSNEDLILRLLDGIEKTHNNKDAISGEMYAIIIEQEIFTGYKLTLTLDDIQGLEQQRNARRFLRALRDHANRLLPLIAGLQMPERFERWMQMYLAYAYSPRNELFRA